MVLPEEGYGILQVCPVFVQFEEGLETAGTVEEFPL
jgi:hypothetical protein